MLFLFDFFFIYVYILILFLYVFIYLFIFFNELHIFSPHIPSRVIHLSVFFLYSFLGNFPLRFSFLHSFTRSVRCPPLMEPHSHPYTLLINVYGAKYATQTFTVATIHSPSLTIQTVIYLTHQFIYHFHTAIVFITITKTTRNFTISPPSSP